MRTEFEFFSPVKIVSGIGECRNLEKWTKKFNAEYLLLLTGPVVAKTDGFLEILASLQTQGIKFDVISDTLPEPPVELIDELAGRVRNKAYDMAVAVGGGSVIDTAKAVCMLKNNEGMIAEYLFGGSRIPEKESLPLICIPTTAGSGSEVSCAAVIDDTDKHVKLSCTHHNLYPKIAILDPVIQKGMPASVTAGTGMDAMTHAIESYTSKNATVISEIYSRRAIELIAEHLPIVYKEPDNLKSRMLMAEASTLAAIGMANGGLGAVHGLSQSMGGIAHTPHGITNAIVLPEVMKYNYKGAVKKFAEISGLMGADTKGMSVEEAAAHASQMIEELNGKIGIAHDLSGLNVKKNMADDIVKATMDYRLLWMNPVPFTEETAYKVLDSLLPMEE